MSKDDEEGWEYIEEPVQNSHAWDIEDSFYWDLPKAPIAAEGGIYWLTNENDFNAELFGLTC